MSSHTLAVEFRPDGVPALAYRDRPRPPQSRRHPFGFAPGGLTPGKGQATTVGETDDVSWERMAELAGADWRVEARPTYTTRSTATASGKRALEVEGERTLVRLGTAKSPEEHALKTVSDSYGLVQNAEVYSLLTAVAMRPEALMVLNNGRSLVAEAVAGADFNVRPGVLGVVRRLARARWSHGLGAVHFTVELVALVCLNGATRTTQETTASVRHTSNAADRVARLAHTLERRASEQAEWLTTARRLAETDARRVLGPLTTRAASSSAVSTPVADLLSTALQGEPTKFTDLHARSQNVIEDVLQIARKADPATGVAGDGSLYDLFQALTFYSSHNRTVRGLSGSAAETARAVSDAPAYVGATWDALTALATDAAPVSVLVRS